MDTLDRMYRHLVRTVRARFPQYLTQPFAVGELYQTILPYRLHRRELAIQSNDDYELALTELLAGARDYLIVDDRMRDTLRAELGAKNPDPSAFKQFATATVALSPSALRSLEAGPASDTPPVVRAQAPASVEATPERAAAAPAAIAPPSAAVAAPSATAAPPAAPPPTPSPLATPTEPTAAVSVPRGGVTPRPGAHCQWCDQELPAGRAITFCPHCGQNLTMVNCAACGAELEMGWKFCPTCGRSTITRPAHEQPA
jgi:predicted RNA-binding Zn-ribbon protein involved in translation (DUF1610 family)